MFDKIIAVSLNPALDVTLWLSGLDFKEPNTTLREVAYAGGKAINVARVMASNAFRQPVKTLGFCGDQNEAVFLSLLDKDHVDYDFIRLKGDTRQNLTLVIPDGRVVKINRQGCPVTRDALLNLRSKIKEEAEGAGKVLLVFSGSLPPNISKESYKALILQCKRSNIEVAIDTSVFTIEDYRELRPFVIKPNLPEFKKICNNEIRTEAIALKYCKILSEHVDHILLSLGAKGLLYCGRDDGNVRIVPPSVEVKSTVGAGDTTLAAFLSHIQSGAAPKDAAVLACAAGTASVMLDGTDIVQKELIDQVYEGLQQKELS